MKKHRIALYPGDGIGVDVTESAVAVVGAMAGKLRSFDIEFERFDWGCDFYEKNGCVVPDGYLETLRGFDAIFLGAVGWPERLPDHITLRPLIEMRQTFDLYACVRPARTFPGVMGPLRNEGPIDLIVVRENSEGEYIDVGGFFAKGTAREVALQTATHSRTGIERILRFSFELARSRRKRLTMITKSNAQKYSYVLWDRVLEELKSEFEDVVAEKLHVDAAALEMVRRPYTFDVIASSNLFGDILSDLTGGVTGSLGLNPSANLNPERTAPSLFEPVHGSAPDIAGKGIANPAGAILSAGMMLDWLGEKEAASSIATAVERTFADKKLTPDVGGTLTTEQFTLAVIERLD